MLLRCVAGLMLACAATVVLSSASFAGPLAMYEPVEFEPLALPATEADTLDLFVSQDLERTPRDYVRVTATVKGSGVVKAALVLVDILNREHRGPEAELARDQEVELGVDMDQVGHPISMLRGVRLYLEGQAVQVLNLRFFCATENVPKPDAVVREPLDDTSIQAALDSLGEDGGVVYIPAGTYIINNQITVPTDNITIYGDGRDTVIQGTWFEARALILAEDKQNLRFTRLHLRSLPIDEFRGYNDQRYAERPEDVGRPTVTSRGIRLVGCRNSRVDHCEIELFGHLGVSLSSSSEVCVDHCFFHENFRYGLGYGVVPSATTECYIEDSNFENHRHGVAGGRGTMASYTCRFNRFVKDTAAVPAEGWKQVTSHEIDVHSGCSWLYAHDNYVEMRNGMMSSGACLRGNPGWVYRNLFVNCNIGIYCVGASDDIWTWDNEFTNVPNPQQSKATGNVYFDERPPNFEEIAYPYQLNRLGWWPGAESADTDTADPDCLYAGPEEPQVLRRVKETAP